MRKRYWALSAAVLCIGTCAFWDDAFPDHTRMRMTEPGYFRIELRNGDILNGHTLSTICDTFKLQLGGIAPKDSVDRVIRVSEDAEPMTIYLRKGCPARRAEKFAKPPAREGIGIMDIILFPIALCCAH